MVVLVRCLDDTIALALESRLDDLKEAGLIAAVLRDGSWVEVVQRRCTCSAPIRRRERITATVASCCAPF
ncbi:GSU3473 family protein [Geomesophilobacter sediminis]|uniref:Uncharacterized protein n=1 Tax=Geomesophilobacter sediminis TaxID=2798584 RepID=A0A8J7JEF3_9BACT|nr:hypothetical protein [Geomesophilobacter sediminis]MBJ6724419.1 hypothetical protein [Geomesophilobacter sediminis]